MTIRIVGTDGQGFQFPDGTPDDEIRGALDRHYSQQTNPAGAAEDVAKAAGSGLATGAVSTAVGLPGTVAGLTNQAADFLARQTAGRLYNRFAPGGTGDFSADVRPDPNLAPPSIGPEAQLPTMLSVEERLPQYTPATTAGRYAQEAGKFAGSNLVIPGGGGVVPRLVAGAAGGVGAEAAGDLVAGTTLEPYAPYAKVAGALIAPGIAARAITPLRGDPELAAQAQALRQEGIQVSAGQAKGNEALKTAESQLGQMPFSKPVAPNQQAQFNAAVGRRMGVQGAEALTGDVMATRAQQLTQQYDDIYRAHSMKPDTKFSQDLSKTMGEYFGRIAPDQKAQFGNSVTSLAQDLQRFGGQLPGQIYQQYRSHFGDLAFAKRETDPAFAHAARDVRSALDDAMERSIEATGDTAAAKLLKETKKHYGAMKTIEDALSRAGADSLGNISPNAILGAATKSAGKAARARGANDLLNLANMSKTLFKMPPNSGTASRLNILNLAQGGGITGHFAGIGGAAGAGLALGVPAIAGRAINSRLGQAWLGNSLLNEGVLSGAAALVNAAQAGRGILGDRR